MKKKEKDSGAEFRLRFEAEAHLSKREKSVQIPKTKVELLKLVHELQVHQIELELQNEELLLAYAEIEKGLDLFTELYDFAPVGYFSISPGGTIVKVNLKGAQIFGTDRSNLINRQFGLFLSPDSKKDFEKEIREAYRYNTKVSFNISFRKSKKNGANPVVWEENKVGDRLFASVEGVVSNDNKEFHIAVNDITAYKTIETALKESEEQYRLLFENAPVGISVADNEGNIVAFNKAILHQGNYTPDDIKKNSQVADYYYHVEQFNEVRLLLETNAFVANHEVLLKRKDGTPYNAMVSLSRTVFNRENSVMAIIEDLTIKKEVEAKLSELDRRFRLLIENSHDVISLLSADGTFLYESPSIKNILGYNTNERIGHKTFEYVHPDEVNDFRRLFLKFVNQSSPTLKTQTRFRHRDGTWRWIEGVRTNLLSDSGVNAIVVNYRDVTDSKNTEQIIRNNEKQFRATFEHAAVGMLHANCDGLYIKVNKRFCEIVGFSEKELLKKKFQEVTHPDGLEHEISKWNDLISGKIQTYSLEKQFVRKNKQTIWCNITVSLVRNGDGSPDYFIGVIEDISTRKRAEDEIIQLNNILEFRVKERTAELAESNHDLETFNQSVSHDLRAPIRFINGFADLLVSTKSDQLDETGLKYLAIISSASKEMGVLINALLDFSKLNKRELKKTYINSNQMVEKAILLFKNDIQERKVKINVSKIHDIYGDDVLINQVWINLISNALKYTRHKEEVKIDIGSMMESKDCVFYIRDNGVGFDMKFCDRLFGVFKRLHKTEDYEGVGIGLANVNKIISRHGGRCWAEGAVDQGATFYFSFPAGKINKKK